MVSWSTTLLLIYNPLGPDVEALLRPPVPPALAPTLVRQCTVATRHTPTGWAQPPWAGRRLPLANCTDPGRPANLDATVPRAMPWPCRRGGLANRLSISPACIKGCCRSLRAWPSRHRPPWSSPRWTLCAGRFLDYPKQWNSSLDHPRASTDTSWLAPPSHCRNHTSSGGRRRHGCRRKWALRSNPCGP
jgi:hypothetical protein